MADDWLLISSTEFDSSCDGYFTDYSPENALDAVKGWYCLGQHTHWFVIDLTQTYNISKVKGRSGHSGDPIDVNIYIDDNNPPTTLCEEGITTWQDRADWSEITLTTPGVGRYIKVEIEDTEYVAGELWFGQPGGDDPLSIFDAYGDVAEVPPTITIKPVKISGTGKVKINKVSGKSVKINKG